MSVMSLRRKRSGKTADVREDCRSPLSTFIAMPMDPVGVGSGWLPRCEPFDAVTTRLMFVDRRYRFPSASQAELAEAEGDEGLSVYRIPAEGFWKNAWAGA